MPSFPGMRRHRFRCASLTALSRPMPRIRPSSPYVIHLPSGERFPDPSPASGPEASPEGLAS